mmetsp:Transcript_11539/g.13218  ORF Transcript_11539/g.13218 Transcript_11539/m.13218 type:complete len:1224 (+) Transcript_11539:116-3787(+)
MMNLSKKRMNPLGVIIAITLISKLVAIEQELITDQIEWLISKGGIFHKNLEIRHADPTDPDSHFGMFAKDDIYEDEVLIEIPRDCLITAGDDTGDYGGLWCPTAYNLIKEMRKGDDSAFAPYVKYLSAQSYGQLPSDWSDEGQSLFLDLVNQNDDDDSNDLRPAEPTNWLRYEWHRECGGSNDPFEQNAALMLIQRGWDDIMIPVYDMMSHRNGIWLNTKSNSVHKKSENIKVQASRDIKGGEEIYTSYNFCEDCGDRGARHFGTPEILRDYGFVENFPQRWFLGRKIAFELDEEMGADGSPTGVLKLNWLQKKPKQRAINFLKFQLERLNDFASYELENADPSIPKSELSTMKNYHQAVTIAIKHALDELNVEYDEFAGCKGETCAVSNRYDDLSFKEDDLDYAVYTCDTRVSMAMDHFEDIDGIKSHYQSINFVKDPKNDNVCFDISNVIQMCGSYRPHYHEMVVHYTARFVEKIKRVIWVGGGDSMLLHEIVKYPTLEFVVGLEIDQWVTRLSYKHTGTQPHYDNNKVQWWYGDAAKSLLMLPKEYFGTFDMVLVDLSETVTSSLVTDGLDIMQALALLLKPEGILVKNELYMEQMTDIMDYSIQIHYDGVPVICSQCLILGSNEVDFLFHDIKDHDLDAPNLYIQPLDKIKDNYEYIHDYRRNSTSQHFCDHEGDLEAVPDTQKRSPGILMIIEAEDVTIDLENLDNISNILTSALETEGLTITSTKTAKTSQGGVVILFLAEGYIVARTMPEVKYCAFDVHFWSMFEKQEAVKKALIEAVGSGFGRSSSSYRIVAGGMFGINTWKEDTQKRGPRVTGKCNREASKERNDPVDTDIANSILENGVQFIADSDFAMIVICGESIVDCSSVKMLETNSMISKIVTLTSCPDVSNEFDEGAVLKMRACEKQVYNILNDSIPKEEKFRALVIDNSATKTFARIVYKVLKNKKERMINEDFTALAVMRDEEESWRRNLMERFRKNIILWDTNFRAEVLFNGTDTSLEMDITSSGDDGFVSRLLDIVSGIEKKTGLVSDVRDIKGGLFYKDPDWEWSHFFLPEDYDQNGPMEQWVSQQPMGRQSVMQLEPKKANRNPEITMIKIKSALKEALTKMELVTSEMLKEMADAEFHEIEVGDGGLVAALWSGGNCMILWNGRDHIDLNLFSYTESQEMEDEFVLHFRTFFRMTLSVALRDTFPRGYGRVVNFRSDIGDRMTPHWAKIKE